MYLLDTNHCSNLILGSPVIARRLTELGSASIATCVIVRGELIFWAEKSEQRESNLQAVHEFLADIEVLPVDDAAADFYGEMKATILDRFGPKERAKRRKATTARLGFAENDLWIAAIARRLGLIVVSSDSDFERIAEVTEIKVESWL
jgi:tRNA(fMet)-specific endonuclease VapC